MSPIAPVDVVLRFAKSQLFAREIGANDGMVVKAYQKVTGNKPPDSWCASFVSWCGTSALLSDWPLKVTASCQQLYDAAKDKKLIHDTPQRGDVFVQWHQDLQRYAHTGFVTEANGLAFRTVEGNTNPDGGREGYGVFERARTASNKYRFIRWSV